MLICLNSSTIHSSELERFGGVCFLRFNNSKMDSDGLPLVGPGIDYTKVCINTFYVPCMCRPGNQTTRQDQRNNHCMGDNIMHPM